jgi:ubiquinone/menaquinone biosynthesis C-methylase UbiE
MRRSRSPYSLWSRFWSRRARVLGRRNSDIAGAVERPHPGQRFVHGFELRGWLAPGGTVHVTANGHAVSTLEADRPRPDLAASVPGEVHGFEAWIRPGQLPSGRWLWLRVYGTPPHRPDGPRALIHAFPLRRGAGRALPRWAYGRVWDAAASDVGEARTAVAGFETDDEWHRSGESTAANVATRTGITTDDDVLEIGCGAGRVGDKLAPRCRRWIGADVSQRMIDYARAALARHDNVAFVHLNGFDLDGVADASVDVVYCSAVLMHLDEWDRYRYVCEAMRVLRPGGRAYFDNFDLESPQGWALFEEMSRLDVAERPPNVSRASTRQELLCYLERAGFDDRTCDTGELWVTVVGRKR